MSIKVLCLTKYGRLGASSRLRTLQYVSELGKFECESRFVFSIQSFISDAQLESRYATGGYGASILNSYAARINALIHKKDFDLLWIEKEALPWFPFWAEDALLRGVPYVLDYDDALFHGYDLHRYKLVRRIFGRRLDKLMAGARLVMCGNDYLAERAKNAGAPWVEVVPTVIDLARYDVRAPLERADPVPRIVWIGSPSTVKYLAELEAPLVALAQVLPFKLHVIGAQLNIAGVDIECVHWSEELEVSSIAYCDVGIMPLADSPWERGKCGYKLIQYMACRLPVVASPVGVNCEIVEPGVNGFLAETAEQWSEKLKILLESAALRQKMGAAGRYKVEGLYCLQVLKPKVSRLLSEAADKSNEMGEVR